MPPTRDDDDASSSSGAEPRASTAIETADSRPSPTLPGSHVRPQLAHGALLGGRYRIVRLLGQGAMGTVYQAHDEARSGLRVALKLLAVYHPQALYRLKNEFRALAETVHPNLIGLHGLGSDPAGWFVIMDLIAPCTDFLSYVRADAQRPFDEGRLRSGLSQLLRGVAAIHAAGKLHRDLKPGNILVSDEGRVVVADFGLVGVQSPAEGGDTLEGMFVGTPAYAAPEQARGEAMTIKADMYAVGVVLFEALTGRLPITADSSSELLERKTRESAPDLTQIGPDLPDDLRKLCNALLRRDPGARPDVWQALAQLDGELSAPLPRPAALPFVARERERAALHEAVAGARGGAPTIATVTGPSGIGKSALLANFLEELRRSPASVELSGRSHAHEQLPYNAFDALIDGLGRYLNRLGPVEAASLMPRDVSLLARLFPTLLRVPAVINMPIGRGDEGDERLRRARGFAALKELLARIADRAFLVVCFDDWQWSDEDSRELLRELVRGPGAPSALFVCAIRAGDPRDDARLWSVLDAPGVTRLDLTLEPIDEPSARALARSMLGEQALETDLALLVEEAAGSPFLIKTLSRGATSSGGVSNLSRAVALAMEKLDGDARGLLELVSLAEQPLELKLAIDAAGVAPQAVPACLTSGLLRSELRAGREHLESTHQRISGAVIELLDPARKKALHQSLARALALAPAPDPERVARHFRAAGQKSEATPYTIAAAERAARTLAFGRSAELYELALAEVEERERGRIEVALADALENLGRVHAAGEYLERAARRAEEPRERRDLSSRAMLLFMLAGDFGRSEPLLASACRELGVPMLPRRPWLAAIMRAWLVVRLLLARRMSKLPPPAPESASRHARERIELCFRAARGLFNGKLDACTHFSLLALIETRRLREPYHWPLAMAGEAMWHSMFRADTSYVAVIDRALALAGSRGDPEIRGGVHAVAGLCHITHNRWQTASEHFVQAEEAFVSAGRSASQVYHATRPGRIICAFTSGELLELDDLCETWLAEARDLGDHYGEIAAMQLGAYRLLVTDDPQGARRAIAEARARRSSADDASQADSWWLGDAMLYEGDFEGALAEDRLARRSPYFPGVQRIPTHRIWAAYFLGRASLLAAARTHARRHLRCAARQARFLDSEPLAVAQATGCHIRAGLARLRKDTARERSELEQALTLFAECGMPLHVEATRYRLGELYGDERGDAMMRDARQAVSARGVHNPERWFAMLLPI